MDLLDEARDAPERPAEPGLAAGVTAVLERLIGLLRSLSPSDGLSLTAAATLATLFVLPCVFAVVQPRRYGGGVSLDPGDANSRYFDHS